MKPTIDQLHTPGQYTLIESIRIDDMAAFVTRELGLAPREPGTKGPQNRLIVGLVVLLLMAAGGLVGYKLASLFKGGRSDEAIRISVQVVAGLVLFLALLPVHEVTHGLFFRWVGAPKVGYGGSLKSLMIYAYAQNFVMTLRELALVAVMPFTLITAALIVAWLVAPGYGLAWGMALLLHTWGCIGDFALIRYYQKNRRRPMYTYDDVEGERRSYFFEAVSGA